MSRMDASASGKERYRERMTNDPDYDRWAKTVPSDITADTIWRMAAYRLALYTMALAQRDAPHVLANRLTRPHLDQLPRAVGAISADLDEWYSRSSGRERAHYYEYALGSARESRGWYYKCAAAFPPDILAERLALSQIIRILTAIIPRERTRRVEPRHARHQPVARPPLSNPAARSGSSRYAATRGPQAASKDVAPQTTEDGRRIDDRGG